MLENRVPSSLTKRMGVGGGRGRSTGGEERVAQNIAGQAGKTWEEAGRKGLFCSAGRSDALAIY